MALITGDLRYSIKIMQLTTSKGTYGEAVESYTLLTTLRAAAKFLNGTKAIDNSETFTTQSIQFTTHYRPAVTALMRVEFEGKNYRILSLAEIGYKEGLIINTELINE